MPAQEIIPSGIAKDVTLQDLLALMKEAVLALHEAAGALQSFSADTAGRLRVTLESGSATNAALASVGTITTLTTVSTVTTIGTVTNQAQIGGLAANQAMIALTLGSESDLRRNIVIT